jgi:hypothetical protein
VTNKAEQETVICFTEDDTEATVYTFRRKLWRVCDRAGGRVIRPHVRDGREEAREYRVPLGQLYRVLNQLGSFLADEAARRRESGKGDSDVTQGTEEEGGSGDEESHAH